MMYDYFQSQDTQPRRSRRVPVYVRIPFGRIGSLQTNQSSEAWQALGVPRKRPCGIFGCFIFFWCEHAATRL